MTSLAAYISPKDWRSSNSMPSEYFAVQLPLVLAWPLARNCGSRSPKHQEGTRLPAHIGCKKLEAEPATGKT